MSLVPRYGASVVTVVSPYLLAVDATWDHGPAAGDWIASRLDSFGATVGHAVPTGYPAYAIVPIQRLDDDQDYRVLRALLDVLEPFTGDRPTHSAMWPGFGFMHETGEDPRAGAGVGVAWENGDPTPTREEIERVRAAGIEQQAARRIECPDAEMLALPHREYYLWTGPLRSALAFEHQSFPPSLVWPEDRSWFIGAPIWTNEFAIAGTVEIIATVLSERRLLARTATTDDHLDSDD